MSKPVGIDNTVLTMIKLLDRAKVDEAFRDRCLDDLDSAIGELDAPPTTGDRFEYSFDSEGHTLRVYRKDDVTTCTLSRDGDLSIDSDDLVQVADRDELSDVMLMMVSGGAVLSGYCDDQPTRYLKQMCKATMECYGYDYWSTWAAADLCSDGHQTCIAHNPDKVFYIQCEQTG